MKSVAVALIGLAVVSATVIPQPSEEAVLAKLRNRKIAPEAAKLSGWDLVEYLNANQQYFTAELSAKFAHYPDNIKSRLMGVKNIALPIEYKKSPAESMHIDAAIPASFDARTQWPQCPSIKAVRDQSSCGSCWAFGAAEAMSDRICIATNGAQQVMISADDILSCCGWQCGDGCEGGYPIEAWKYWVHNGLVTGSNYTANAGCKPYPFAPCEHHTNATHYKPCPGQIYPTPKCEKKCQAGYNVPYAQDKHYGKSAYGVDSAVASIQKEIMTNGPVEVSYEVYEDFEHYKGGVYVHTGGQLLGGHAVKMIGWGTENGTPYWICTNSWNSDWGENGFFRIVRGLDECGIESGIVAGLPKV